MGINGTTRILSAEESKLRIRERKKEIRDLEGGKETEAERHSAET